MNELTETALDNFSQILNLLDFSGEDEFYYIQILRRKKDNPDAKHVKVIKDIYVDSFEYWQRKQDYIKGLCHHFNARAYIRLNRRSYRDVGLKMFELMGKYARSQQFKPMAHIFSKAAGNTHVEDPKIWVIDVDEGDYFVHNEIRKTIKELQKEVQKDYKVIDMIRTPNGFHILTNPFNVKKFNEKLGDKAATIHKDNPTVLYVPTD